MFHWLLKCTKLLLELQNVTFLIQNNDIDGYWFARLKKQKQKQQQNHEQIVLYTKLNYNII